VADESTPDNEKAETEPQDFALTLYALNKGAVHTQLSKLMRELTDAVTTVKKAGKLTLTIGMKPHPGADGAVFITANVKSSLPQYDPKPSIFYVNSEAELVRDDPNAQQLPFTITPGTKENRNS
jgi:hypothetical protein